MPFLFLILHFFIPRPIYANDHHTSVFINEFQIEPEQAVELVNRTMATIDISNWYLDDDGGTTFYTIPAGTTIQPNRCIVLKGSLNLNKSSEDTLRLFDNTALPIEEAAQLMDSFTYPRSPGNLITFQRYPDGGNWATGSATLGAWNETKESCILEPTATPLITPTAKPQPTQTPTQTHQSISNIYISEFYPAPLSGEKEWIELYNNNDFEVTLTNWYIDDAENAGASPKIFTTRIAGHGYAVVELTTAIFNNSGDQVRILDSAKKVIDELTYDESENGVSIGWDEILGSVYCLQNPTPNKENTSCSQVPKEIVERSFSEDGSVLGITQTSDFTNAPQIKQSQSTHFLISASLAQFDSISPIHPEAPDQYLKQSQSVARNLSQAQNDAFPISSIALLSICSIAAKMKLQL